MGTPRNELTDAVQNTLSTYLSELGDQPPGDIYSMVIRHVERAMIELVMDRAGGNQTKAAGMLGVSRNTLRRKLEQYRIA